MTQLLDVILSLNKVANSNSNFLFEKRATKQLNSLSKRLSLVFEINGMTCCFQIKIENYNQTLNYSSNSIVTLHNNYKHSKCNWLVKFINLSNSLSFYLANNNAGLKFKQIFKENSKRRRKIDLERVIKSTEQGVNITPFSWLYLYFVVLVE